MQAVAEPALAASMVAYLGGLVSEEAHLDQLVALFGYAEIPARGARLVEGLMAVRAPFGVSAYRVGALPVARPLARACP